MIELDRNTIHPIGFDAGNGFVNVVFGGKHASAPAGYMLSCPQGQYNAKRQTHAKPQAQQITVCGKSIWVGRDTLTDQMIRRLDGAKYDKDHLRMIISGGIAEWVRKYKAQIDSTLRLRAVCGMPAQSYQDINKRRAVERAYKAAFKTSNSDQWTITACGQSFRLIPELASIQPETSGYGLNNKLSTGYTVIIDVGYGTVDVVVLHSSDPTRPVTVKSFNTGLTHVFGNIEAVQVEKPELLLMRNEINPDCLEPYLSQIQEMALQFQRALTGPVKIKIVGGLAHLMSAQQKARFNTGATFVFGDASENAKTFFAAASGS